LEKKMNAKTQLLKIAGAMACLGASAIAQVPNPYKVWNVDPEMVNINIKLIDQYGPWTTTLDRIDYFANPADKVIPPNPPNPPTDPTHYVWYHITSDPFHGALVKNITDQFGDHQFIISQAEYYLVPSDKEAVGGGQDGPPYICYPIKSDEKINVLRDVNDQFATELDRLVMVPRYFCIEGDKATQIPPANPSYLMFYEYSPNFNYNMAVTVLDQFHTTNPPNPVKVPYVLDVTDSIFLGVEATDKVSNVFVPAVSPIGVAVMIIAVLAAGAVVVNRRRAGSQLPIT
jgi:hypothetical protein